MREQRDERSDVGCNVRRHNADHSATHQVLIRHEGLAGELTPTGADEDVSRRERRRKGRLLVSPVRTN